MYRISDISLDLDGTMEDLKVKAAKRLRVTTDKVKSIKLYKKSVDARKKDSVHFICTVEADCDFGSATRDGKIKKAEPYKYAIPQCKKLAARPVVVGFGPAGMYAALILARAGQEPIIIERGSDADKRKEQVECFFKTGNLDTESNVQFGEGGAGTFSDGKLNTGTKDARARVVLEEFAKAGAPEEILYLAKPHIGTDKLPSVVKNIRRQIIELGGEVRFESKMTKLITENGSVKGIEVKPRDGDTYVIDTGNVVLAIGHSARDTLEMLYSLGLPMEPKPFSVGARIEHPQQLIDRAQYGKKFAGNPHLGAADYNLAVHLKNGRGVYTFCMCPGGKVVAAASEENRLATNGMSNFARDGENANSALLVGVAPKDFGGEGPLAGVYFQRRLEEKAFTLGGGNYRAPVQRVEDFLLKRASKDLGGVKPSYPMGVTPCSLDGCLPGFIADSMREGIKLMDRRLSGFAYPDAVLTAVESRSSSPVRLLRDDGMQSVSFQGLYPCGEGAGYAGGIVSAAVDGIKCAEKILISSNI